MAIRDTATKEPTLYRPLAVNLDPRPYFRERVLLWLESRDPGLYTELGPTDRAELRRLAAAIGRDVYGRTYDEIADELRYDERRVRDPGSPQVVAATVRPALVLLGRGRKATGRLAHARRECDARRSVQDLGDRDASSAPLSGGYGLLLYGLLLRQEVGAPMLGRSRHRFSAPAVWRKRGREPRHADRINARRAIA
jgi:hypothetical protein